MRRSTCGIRNVDELYCWGHNGWGQLGLGDTVDRSIPTKLDLSWGQVDGGLLHACGLTTTRVLRCWGRTSEGQTGTDPGDPLVVPTIPSATIWPLTSEVFDPLTVTWRAVSAGDTHTCALGTFSALGYTDDLFCTGDNTHGQLGVGGGEVPNPGSTRFLNWFGSKGTGWSRVSAGADHACGIRNGGDLWCWGRNFWAQLGDGTITDRYEPVLVSGTGDWFGVSAGHRHTVGTRLTE